MSHIPSSPQGPQIHRRPPVESQRLPVIQAAAGTALQAYPVMLFTLQLQTLVVAMVKYIPRPF